MNWQEEQAQFWAWISRPQDLGDSAEAIAAVLAPHAHLSQAEALSIYNNAYHQRLVEVSSALFPVLYHTLGKDLYTRLWIAYIGEHPPRHGPIHRIGDTFASFVRTHPVFSALPAVADIVQLESLLGQLFDRPDETAFTQEDLKNVPESAWPSLRWQAKQDWALFFSPFDLEPYWREMQAFREQGGEPGATPFSLAALTPVPPPSTPNFLVFRQHLGMHFQQIRPEFSTFLLGISEGENFATLCQRLAKRFPEQDTAPLSLTLLLRAMALELLTQPAAPQALS